MKVGILTQHFYKNYGGILQNWALQQILLGMGHEPLTFEHDTCYTKRRWLMRMVKHIISERSLKRIPEYPYKGRIGHKPFIDFVLKHINSETVRVFTSDIEKKYGIDAFIVGSDQVWRPAFNSGRLYNMYLDFASDSVKKIAYAASFGVSRWEYSNNQTEKCRKLLILSATPFTASVTLPMQLLIPSTIPLIISAPHCHASFPRFLMKSTALLLALL